MRKMKIENTMKVAGLRFACGELAKLTCKLMAAVAFFTAGNVAQAHLTYSGRNLGAYSGLTNGTTTITNQTVTGNYGWADSADGVLGDSHRARAFRFYLENPALITFNVTANPNATTNSLAGFTPAFSLYSGLAAVAPFAPTQTTNPPSADHDGTPASLAWRTGWVQQNLNPAATDESPTDGCWNALGDFKIGGDGDLPGDFNQLSSLIYKGSVASTNSGGSVSASYLLPAGDYSILVGGNDIANKTADTAHSPHGISVTLVITPTPALSIAQKVFVAWPVGTTANWVLQSSSSVNGGIWIDVTNTPVVVDGQPGVILDRSADEQFFRFNYIP